MVRGTKRNSKDMYVDIRVTKYKVTSVDLAGLTLGILLVMANMCKKIIVVGKTKYSSALFSEISMMGFYKYFPVMQFCH